MYRFLRALLATSLLSVALVLPGSPAHAAGQSTWSTGTMAAGTSKTWHWNNADTSVAYRVGLSPKGATTTATCAFEVTREWYVQRVNSGGSAELEYWFTVKNVGTIICSADVLLSWIATTHTYGTVNVPPGPEAVGVGYYDDPWSVSAAVPAVTLSGATASTPCEFEVKPVRVRFDLYSGQRTQIFPFDNISAGSGFCQATVRLAVIPAGNSWMSGSIAPDSTKTWHWNNANPLTAVYAVSLGPQEKSIKDLQVERTWYVQRINGGVAEREFWMTIRDLGSSTSRTARVLLARVS